MTNSAKEMGRDANESNTLGIAARAGLACYGFVHLLVAWLAISLALGAKKGSASSDGALAELAEKPFGSVLLYIVAAGFVALVIWQLIEAFVGHRDLDGLRRKAHRAGSGFKVILFGVLGFSALKIAMGGGASSESKTNSMTSRIMTLPSGQILVGLVGLVIIGVGFPMIYRGLSEGFAEKLTSKGRRGGSGRVYVWFGEIGYASKGTALFAVGGLFLWAAATHDPKKSGGLDQALHTVLAQPFGSILLTAIAIGIGCFGLFCFAQARHLDR